MSHEFPDDPDGQVLRNLAADGHDLSEPMVIEFHVAAPDQETAERIQQAAEQLGYSVQIDFDDEPLPPWTCYCERLMLAEYDAILAAQNELDQAARPLGGYCDGWGTFGNAADDTDDAE